MSEKLAFEGLVVGIQPRIRLMRSFDQRDHAYLGFALRIDGTIDEIQKQFIVGIGNGTQEKFAIQAGNQVVGECLPVVDPELEPVEFYKVSKFRVLESTGRETGNPPPCHGVPPVLTVYQERGHRRLASQTYEVSCTTCIWGCRMAVEMIIDQWNPDKRKYRSETFCYGPKSCRLYRSGPPREVPGRRGMTWIEEDWVDEDATSGRGEDD